MTAPTHTDERIHDHIKDLNGQIARCDSKASLLLALTGTSLAGVVSVAANARPAAAALTVGSLGAALLFTATMLLLAVVRPNTTGPGWPRWPEMNDTELDAALHVIPRLPEARTLAALARRKYQGVRRAVDCTRAGLALLALAGVLAAR